MTQDVDADAREILDWEHKLWSMTPHGATAIAISCYLVREVVEKMKKKKKNPSRVADQAFSAVRVWACAAALVDSFCC